MCQYLEDSNKTCSVGGVEVDLIDCTDIRLCTGRRYEACPVYYVSFFVLDHIPYRAYQ